MNRTEYFYCIKTFEEKFFGNLIKSKIYKARLYSDHDRNYITIRDEYNNDIDLKVNSMLYNDLIPEYIIPLKEARKLKLKKLNNA